MSAGGEEGGRGGARTERYVSEEGGTGGTKKKDILGGWAKLGEERVKVICRSRADGRRGG